MRWRGQASLTCPHSPLLCLQDAIKLFIGNIPKLCTEEQLLPFFETIGKVVELVIVRDKISHESKGSAFVWYSSRAHAERAILQFNLRHVLPDPSGEQVSDSLGRSEEGFGRKVGMVAGWMRGARAQGLGPCVDCTRM